MRNNALAVPQVAVLDGTQGKYVYVADKDKDGKDIAAVRLVTLGDWVTAGRRQPVGRRSGLKAGDLVIVDGVAKLRPVRRSSSAAARRRRRPAPGAAPAKDAAPAPKA